MFEDLKKNIEQEKKIIADMHSIKVGMQNDATNQRFYLINLNALSQQLILLNKTVPEFLKEGSPIKNSPKTNVAKPSMVNLSYISPSTKEKKYITINKADKKKFLEKLKLSEDTLSALKRKNRKNIKGLAIPKPNAYAKISNKFFLKHSEKFVPKFDDLYNDLKKANIRFLLSTYLSMAMMSMMLSFILGSLIFGIIIAIDLTNWIYFLIPFGLTFLTMVGFYL